MFLSFLMISTLFWFMSTLNDTYETEFTVELKIGNIPEHVVITEDLPESFKITVKDKGFNLLRYAYINPIPPLTISFGAYSGAGGHGVVKSSDVQKMMGRRLSESTKIISVKADHWDFYYAYGGQKKVPVQVKGKIQAMSDYYVMRTTVSPDSVVIYATEEAFDTINVVYTEPLMLHDLSSSVVVQQRLQHIYGAKIEGTDTAKVSVTVDRLTEVMISVPVKPVNWPDNIQIKTFPAKVSVRVSVGVSNLRTVKPELFTVVADYKDLPKNSHGGFPIKLISQPKGIVRANLKNSEVDYVIENLNR